MVKRYSEELAAWIEKRATKKRRLDAAAVAFIAVKSDVIEAMDAGYAMTTIWEHMRETGRVKVSYETFRRHVQRYITAPAPAAPAPAPAPQTGQAKPAKPSRQGKVNPNSPPPKTEAPTIGGFNFNPKPNKEDLL